MDWLPSCPHRPDNALPSRSNLVAQGNRQASLFTAAQELCGADLIRVIADREDPSKWTKESIKQLHRLGYQFEHHKAKNDPLSIAAAAAVRSPVLKTTINLTLAIRKALRRYLGIEPALPNPAIRESP